MVARMADEKMEGVHLNDGRWRAKDTDSCWGEGQIPGIGVKRMGAKSKVPQRARAPGMQEGSPDTRRTEQCLGEFRAQRRSLCVSFRSFRRWKAPEWGAGESRAGVGDWGWTEAPEMAKQMGAPR